MSFMCVMMKYRQYFRWFTTTIFNENIQNNYSIEQIMPISVLKNKTQYTDNHLEIITSFYESLFHEARSNRNMIDIVGSIQFNECESQNSSIFT